MIIHKKLADDRGSFTIEAILSLSVFMFAFIMIASLALVTKVEGVTQYAINQTSKEISKFCYIPSRVGLLKGSSYDGEKVDNVDDTIGAVMSFSDSIENSSVVKAATTSTDLDSAIKNLGTVGDDYQNISTSAKALYSQTSSLLSDPKGTIVALTKLSVDKSAKKIVSRLIAQPVCETLFQKYVTTSNGNADDTLKNLGVVDGLSGLNFGMSTFLMDDRTINVVLVYKVKVKGFGLGDKTITVTQTASTAAWKYNDTTIPKDDSQSLWDMQDDLARGKKFVSIIQNEENLNAVDNGSGVDLYNPKKNTFTVVHSTKLFDKSYSDFNEKAGEGHQYTLRDKDVQKNMKYYADKIKGSVDKIDKLKVNGQEVRIPSAKDKTRNSRVVYIVPKKTAENKDMNDQLLKDAKEVEKATGVEIYISYRDK